MLPNYEYSFVENSDEDTITNKLVANPENYSLYTKQTNPQHFAENISILKDEQQNLFHVKFSISLTIPKVLVFTFSYNPD
jgi:hypothetical protein